jgi:nucleoside-diphosphate-sugar epimerase
MDRVLVTGSSGHLGEALVRTLRADRHEVVGLDLLDSQHTTMVGSVADAAIVRRSMRGCRVVFHAATLHKPHVVTHTRQQFVDTNVSGTLTLLEEAVRAGVDAFVFTSSTSVFGDALRPRAAEPAVWVTEDIAPRPRNIYGVTKIAAEDLCRLFNRKHDLRCVVLRTSRFFPEEDDDAAVRSAYENDNLKANELLFRRVDLADVVDAHLLAAEKAGSIGFGTFIVSATTPFQPADVHELRRSACVVVGKRVPQFEEVYARRRWRMVPAIDRVYVNDKARNELGWSPKHDFAHLIECLRRNVDPRSELARAVGSKGYHAQAFEDGPYPVE